MKAVELMADFSGRGITLEAAPGGRLRYSPKDKLDANDVALLKAHKESILKTLSFRPSPLSPVSPTPRNTDKYEDYSGDTGGDTNENFTVTGVTATEAELPEFVRQRYRRANHLGLIAKWSFEFGYVSVHDPTTSEWHDLPTKEAPPWAVNEARKRKGLCKSGKSNAFELTARQMEEIWKDKQAKMWEHPAVTDKGILYEDYREEFD